jgi:hypothetical protein
MEYLIAAIGLSVPTFWFSWLFAQNKENWKEWCALFGMVISAVALFFIYTMYSAYTSFPVLGELDFWWDIPIFLVLAGVVNFMVWCAFKRLKQFVWWILGTPRIIRLIPSLADAK